MAWVRKGRQEVKEADLLEATRISCQTQLLSFCKFMNKNFKTPKHLRMLAKKLEAVERGEIKRLIITVPPRHGKSYLVSRYFPAWYIGRNKEKYIITATYGAELSQDFGRAVRDVVTDSYYEWIFGRLLKNNSRSIDHLVTELGGEYFCVGAGGAITGRGAHLFLIDDPVKNREEADSKTMREKLYSWYKSVAYTRLMPGGAIVVIMTRWHESDLVGQIVAEDKDKKFEIFNMPAINEDGTPLCPEFYDIDALNDIRETIGDFEWSCLYMQNPLPQGGIIFNADWFISGLDEDYVGKYMAIDPAISLKTKSDETAITTVGVRFKNGLLHLDEIETVHGHWDFDTQIKVLEQQYDKHKPVLIGVESVAYQQALFQHLIGKGLPVMELKVNKDKVMRANKIMPLMSQGRVRINSLDLKRQMLSFQGKDEKNDLVDAAVHAISLAMDYSGGGFEKPKDPLEHLSGSDKLIWKNHLEEKEGNAKKDINYL